MISRERKKLMWQYAAAFTASMTTLGFGCVMSWPSPGLSYLMSEKSHLPISKEESDSIASLYPVGFIIGYLVNPILIDKIGTKKTLLALAFPQITSWLLIILAKNSITICIARILAGISYGAGICTTLLYLSEVDKIKRGKFMVLQSLSTNIGIVVPLFAGSFVPYEYMNIFLLMIPIVFISIFVFMPDHFDEENKKKHNNEIKTEEKFENLINLRELEETDGNQIKIGKIFKVKETRFWKLFASRNNRRASIILMILASQLIFSGDVFVTTFAQQIFTYSGASISGENSAIITESMKTIGCLISALVVERLGRKVLLVSTGSLGSFGMGLVGIFFLFEEKKVNISSWVPIIGVALYNVMYPIGYISMFLVYQGELFTKDLKSVGVLLAEIVYMAFTFLGLFWFQKLVDIFGPYNLFFTFALYGAAGTFILFSITPETKGKTSEEIQDVLKSRRSFFFSF